MGAAWGQRRRGVEAALHLSAAAWGLRYGCVGAAWGDVKAAWGWHGGEAGVDAAWGCTGAS